MRICDRCEKKEIVMRLVNQITHEEFDLCASCSSEFEEWIHPTTEVEPEERKRGRPRKDGNT